MNYQQIAIYSDHQVQSTRRNRNGPMNLTQSAHVNIVQAENKKRSCAFYNGLQYCLFTFLHLHVH